MKCFRLPIIRGFYWYRCLNCGFLFFRISTGDTRCPVCGSYNTKKINGGF